MGLFGGRQRRAEHDRAAGSRAYDDALREGASAQEAEAAAERAVRRRRRRRRIIIIGGANSG